MTPEEALKSVQDSIRSAESIYSENIYLRFAADTNYPMCINIAIGKILTPEFKDKNSKAKRQLRLEVLRILFNRQPCYFSSSKDMTLAGAAALRDRLYGPYHPSINKFTPMKEDCVLAIKEAHRLATNEPSWR